MNKHRVAVLFLCFIGIGWCEAQQFTVSPITRTTASGWVSVDDGWAQGVDLLKVRIRPEETIQGTPKLMAGFFNKEGRLIRKTTKVPHLQARGGDYQSLPPTLEAGRNYDIFFPIPPSIASGPDSWNAFVVKFGDGKDAAGAVYPADRGDLIEFDFSGSANDAAHGSSDSSTATVVPKIKQVVRYRNSMNGLIDGEWKTGLTTLRAEVRLDQGAEAGNFFVKAYFFDSKGLRIFDYQKPPQVEVKRGSEYVSLPPRWENETDYDIHFPVPPSIERGNSKWRTAVIVFGNPSVAVARMYPEGSAELDTLDFPEQTLVQTEQAPE